MKYLSIISLGLLALVTGCTKLEPKLYSDLTTANAYSTESDVNAALVGIYADLNPYPGDAWMYYAGYLVMTTDYTTDMGFSTAAGDPDKMSNFTYDANNRYIRYNWQFMYNVISNANFLLANIEGVPMDEANKKRIIGQARFLRALAYRDITDAWEPAPLYTEPVLKPVETANAPLASIEEIDRLIIEDCKYGIENLPEAWDKSEISRATKGACATLLANVYMRAHKYEEAKPYVDMVLALKDAGVYKLNPDFKNVWSENNKFDGGFIFCILHEAGMNGGEITNHFGPSDHKEVTNRWQYYGVSLEFWRKYHDLDPRKQFFYYDYEGASPRDKDTKYGFYYMVPAPGQTTPPADTVKFLKNVATKKYSYDMVSNSYYDGRTIAIFRIEDVILYKAEIENELNGPTAALPYINQIRVRAGAPEYGSGGVFPAPASKEEMAQKILDERGYELVFEYKRRPDLIRFGKYVSTSNDYLTSRGLAPVVKENMKYLPYPLIDAQLNNEMAAENLNRVP